MRQVFISYSSRDAQQANEIVDMLEKHGIECWIAPRDIRVGSNYTKDIPSSIRECPCFLLVLSRNSQNSKWVNKELTLAINQDKLILPLMIEDFVVDESIEFLLGDVQARPSYRTKAQTMQEVVEEIQRMMPLKRPSSAPVQKPVVTQTVVSNSVTKADVPDSKTRKLLSADELYHMGLEFKECEAIDKAEECFQSAANHGHPDAQFELGFIAEAGKRYVRNYGLAIYWYQKAADQGHRMAQYRLGICYFYGHGVIENQKTAVLWLRKAADQGQVGAQSQLGYCYQFGKGVIKNRAKAKKWYQQAADQGDEFAKERLKELQ